ncbi:MAG: dTMP kinase [Gammaproteobacteria bacterium]|jgi:dTMP kinase|nr:dTMP kinase [Gammaproteobacteria bacterium]|tara:strand:- start:868 stop:1494 length:627 start_codon:yes stop_codon:yes gene_type:complete
MSGLFITIEGIECVGKSTNAKFISDLLNKKNIKTHVTREPGGTSLGEKIRKILLFEQDDSISPLGELLLLFAAREKHINEVIKPNLEQGKWVISDRFTDASFAYQGFGRGLGFDQVNQLKQIIQNDFDPDLTFLLDAPIDVIKSRRKLNPNDRFESEDRQFFERVRQGYLQLASVFEDRVRIIDATQPIEQVQSEIQSCLLDFIGKAS